MEAINFYAFSFHLFLFVLFFLSLWFVLCLLNPFDIDSRNLGKVVGVDKNDKITGKTVKNEHCDEPTEGNVKTTEFVSDTFHTTDKDLEEVRAGMKILGIDTLATANTTSGKINSFLFLVLLFKFL